MQKIFLIQCRATQPWQFFLARVAPLFCLLWTCGCGRAEVRSPAGAAAKLYQQKIVFPADSDKALKAAVEDAAQTLRKMTGQTFAISSEYGAAGILLVKSSSPLAPAEAKAWLKDKGREPFVIRSEGKDKLWIIANRDDGLSHGLYFYLEQLGVRFYFPSDKWTIIPAKSDITLSINRQMAPDYEFREFAGTGGWGPAFPNDPDRQIKARWEQWTVRNRFGGEFWLGGHSGEAFNIAYKKTLLEHPEYLAKVDGKHVEWSEIAKLNTANPEVVKLYVDWTVERLRQIRKYDPNGRNANTISVDPSDGGGHCNSDECKAIGSGSASDQVFYVANQAAKAVAKEFPGAYVNLYAYNDHAQVPTIALEPNMRVAIIPYAFQRTGLSPEEFIQAWGKKMRKMALYDYWSIPDWSGDLPSFDYLREPGQKLRYWHANNISAFLSESTYSAGAIGLAWYASSRMMWDLKTDEQAIYKEFYEKAFGAAAPPMQRMMERWANNFMLTSNELALSYRDMQEALKLAKNPEERARIADYGRYLEYLRLRFAWEQAEGEQKREANAALVHFAWDIYHSAMIHSYRIYQLQARSDKELRESYDPANKEGAAWKAISPPTDEAIFAAIDRGAQQFQPLGYAPRRFRGELVALPGTQVSAGDKQPEMVVVGPTEFDFLVKPGQDAVAVKVKSEAPIRVQLRGASGKLVQEQSLLAETVAGWHELKLAVPLPGRYRVKLIVLKTDLISLQLPENLPVSFAQFRTSKPYRSPRLYFYVPRGLTKLAVYQPLPLPEIMEIHFYDADGNAVKAQTLDNRTMYLVDILAGMDGKVWSLDNLVSPDQPIQMLNVPQSFSVYAQTLLVPRDAIGNP